jgi:WD40 repeat protein
MTFSADGKTLFTSADDGIVRVWDVAGAHPRVVRSLAGRRGSRRLVLDPSGRYLASSGVLSGADVWDLHSSSEKAVCVIRPDWINNIVEFDPSGRFLLTAGADKIVTLWMGWERGAPQAIFRQKLSVQIHGAVFSRDGKRLTVIGDDPRPTMLRTLWQPDDLLKIACELARPAFSRSEWHYVLPGIPYESPCR